MQPGEEDEHDVPLRESTRKRAMPSSRLYAQLAFNASTSMSGIRQYPSTALAQVVNTSDDPQHEDKRQRQPSHSHTVHHRMPMETPEAGVVTPPMSLDDHSGASQSAYPDPAVQARFRPSAGAAAFVPPPDYVAQSIADDPRMFFGAPMHSWELVDNDEYENDFPSVV